MSGRTPPAVACLDPRQPSTPVPDWLPDRTGVTNFEPENTGTPRTPSAQTSALASQFKAAIGLGFEVSTLREFATASCVVDRDVVLTDASGDVVFLRVLQLGQPFNDGSFPLLGNDLARRTLSDGTLVLTNHVPDNSSISVAAVHPDGLFVFAQVRSANGPDPTGWPTTTVTAPASEPATPAPVTIDRATVMAQDLLSVAAAN